MNRQARFKIKTKALLFLSWFVLLSLVTFLGGNIHAAPTASSKKTIKSLYIPLADHYAALVAYELYRGEMKYANFQIEQMKNWDLLRAYFQSGEVDMAYVMSPLAMDMFSEKPHFRWIGLMHRDGNALAINEMLNKEVQLPVSRFDRKPNDKVAVALKKAFAENGRATEVGVPHLLATHTVVLYRYLTDHGLDMNLTSNTVAEVRAIVVPPPRSPSFIKGKGNRAIPAAFEQSLPWADVVETGGYGKVAWYSKDLMSWPNGHVECIALATDYAINNKTAAVNEVMAYIRRAGQDIETARNSGGEALEAIVEIIRKHIPAHTRAAIIASLNPKLRVINYQHLNVDKAGLRQIMELAVEGGILDERVDLDAFADTRFDSQAGS